jgi:hypothetical protein
MIYFGDWVSTGFKLKRETFITAQKEKSKRWKRIPRENPIQRVIFIGWRTLSNGSVHYNYDHRNYHYYPKEFIRCALVVEDDRTTPYYVLAEDLQEVRDDTCERCGNILNKNMYERYKRNMQGFN